MLIYKRLKVALRDWRHWTMGLTGSFVSLFSLTSAVGLLAVVASEPAHGDVPAGQLLERRALDSPFADREAFLAFMEKGPGWRREVLERAFPAADVAACIDQEGMTVEHLRYQGHGGVVNAWAVLPEPRRDAPLVLFNRGGAARWGRLLGLDRFTFCRLARAGYAVLASDFRGDPDREGEDRTDLGLGDAQDSIDLIAVARTLGGIDTERLALWGFSRGTMLNAIMLGRLNAVRAVIMVGAAVDSVDNTRRAEFDEHVYPLLVPNWATLGRDAQDAMLREISPRYLIESIRGQPAFLFLHGGADQRTPPAAMLRHAAALIEAGHRTGVHVTEGATHALAEDYDTMIDRILDWLDRHLRDAETEKVAPAFEEGSHDP